MAQKEFFSLIKYGSKKYLAKNSKNSKLNKIDFI